jgi:hypothetical protein
VSGVDESETHRGCWSPGCCVRQMRPHAVAIRISKQAGMWSMAAPIASAGARGSPYCILCFDPQSPST